MSKETGKGSSSFFSSMGKYIQDIKEQVDSNAPGIIAQAKTAIDAQAVVLQKVVGAKVPNFSESAHANSPVAVAAPITEDANDTACRNGQVISVAPVVAVESGQLYKDEVSCATDGTVGGVSLLEIDTSSNQSNAVVSTSNKVTSMLTPPTLPSLAQLTSSSYICPECSTTLNIIESLIPTNKCRICAQLFCSKCIGKSTLPVPCDILHADFLPKGTAASKTAASLVTEEDASIDAASEDKKSKARDEVQYICKTKCTNRTMQRVMEIFRDQINDKFESNFNDFIVHEPAWKEYFSFPEEIPEDTAYRQAVRAAHIAVFVADFTGFSMTLKAVKAVYVGSELLNVLVKGDIIPMLYPLLESLKGYGIDGPSSLLRLYYLGCQHSLRAISNKQPKLPRLYNAENMRGVLSAHISPAVVDYISRYVSAAEWLYFARLPSPHDTMEWSSWYLNKLVKRQGWTVLMCVHETTKLPDGLKCPAFAVVTRIREEKGHKHKEAWIVIRGSMSPMDWSINLQEDMHDDYQYAYFHPSTTPATLTVSFDPKTMLQSKQGYIHKGMHGGAMAMLDGYNLRTHISRLLQAGYEIKCIGHSLGAGVATMVAMEVRNMYMAQLSHSLAQPFSQHHDEAETVSLLRSIWRKVHSVTAVAYACPAFLSPSLAQGVLEDRAVVNIVHGSDAIPRFSHKTLAFLADELRNNQEQTSQWTEEDMLDLQSYMQHLGKASDLHKSTFKNQEKRHFKMQDVREQRLKKSSESAVTPASSDTTELTVTRSSDSNALLSKAQRSAEDSFASLKSMLDYWQVQATPTLLKSASSASASATDFQQDPAVPSAPVANDPREIPPSTKERTSPSTASIQDRDKDATKASKKDVRETVTPGPIVHFYQENNGRMQAAVVTWEHPSFASLEILPTQGLKDHDIQTYRTAIDAVHFLLQNSSSKPPVFSSLNLSSAEQEKLSRYFPVDVDGDITSFTDTHSIILEASKPPSSAVRQDSTSSFVSALDTVNESFTAPLSHSSLLSPESNLAANRSINNNVEGSLVTGDTIASTKLNEDDYQDCLEPAFTGTSTTDDDLSATNTYWTPCHVCGLNVTWPYMLHSAAARAMVTHHCAVCHHIVCTYCAPAGDTIPGDGLNQTIILKDIRITLPSIGIYTPQRVCFPCYFDSSHPGLASLLTEIFDN